MNSVKIKIGKSNINYFENEKIYELTLTKCCGFGSYGFIFKTNIENYVIKILLDPEETYDVKYSDYNEVDVIDKIIDKNNFTVNNNIFATGSLIKSDEFIPNHKKISVYVNEKDALVKLNCIVIKKKRVEKFILKEGFPIIIMPYFLPLYSISIDPMIIKKDILICKLIDSLIKATNEFLEIGFINMDLKMNNAVVDEENNLRFIDFGMIRNVDKINDFFKNDSKYYIWPLETNLYIKIIPYMICIFILELYYPRINFIKNNATLLERILDNFNYQEGVSQEIKFLLRKVLLESYDWNNFLEEFNIIKKKYDMDSVKLNIILTLLQ